MTKYMIGIAGLSAVLCLAISQQSHAQADGDPTVSHMQDAIVFMAKASGQNRAQRVQSPARQSKNPARATQPATIQLGTISVRKKPFDIRAANTPDIDQHATWQSFLNNPAMDNTARAKYAPPAEYDKNMRFFPSDFCGPAAIANNLVWLDRTSYPAITDESNAHAASAMIADKLGRSYMNTMSKAKEENGIISIPTGAGTQVHDLINGTLRYLEERNTPVKTVRVTSAFDYELQDKVEMNGVPLQVDIAKPEDTDIHSALHRRSIVVTLHGHYQPDLPDDFAIETGGGQLAMPPKGWNSPRLHRTGGHYAAPVGYGVGSYGSYIEDRTLYHDSADRNRKTESQTVYDWDIVTNDAFSTNPALVRYHKSTNLPRESLRCPFAPQPVTDADGEKWSLECRGTLLGHSVSYFPVGGSKTDAFIGGMPHPKSRPGDKNGARKVEVLEGMFEFEIVDPVTDVNDRAN